MENTTIKDVVLDKKLESCRYGDGMNNFVADHELTVEITLNEYRELIKSKATADERIRRAEDGKWTRDKENEDLKKQVDYLKSVIVTIRGEDESAFPSEEVSDDKEL